VSPIKNIEDKTNCLDIKIKADNVDVKDLYFVKLLESSLLKKLNLVAKKERPEDDIECLLSVNVKKIYKDLITDDDGNVSGKSARYHVKYELSKGKEVLKKGKTLLFHNINISKHQYSNLTLSDKEDKNNAEKISRKVFFDIRRFF
jgi:hypothetical protein